MIYDRMEGSMRCLSLGIYGGNRDYRPFQVEIGVRGHGDVIIPFHRRWKKMSIVEGGQGSGGHQSKQLLPKEAVGDRRGGRGASVIRWGQTKLQPV